MREQERRRRSPDPAAKGKGKGKRKATNDNREEEEEEEEGGEEEGEGHVLQSDGRSSPTLPPAKRPRKGKEPAKEPTTFAKLKASRSKVGGPTAGASKSKNLRTRSRATINVPPPPGPVLHQEPIIDPQLEEYDVVAQAGYPGMESYPNDFSMPPPELVDEIQTISGWGPDLDALASAYIRDHE